MFKLYALNVQNYNKSTETVSTMRSCSKLNCEKALMNANELICTGKNYVRKVQRYFILFVTLFILLKRDSMIINLQSRDTFTLK